MREEAQDEVPVQVRTNGANDVDVRIELYLARCAVWVFKLGAGEKARGHQVTLDLGQFRVNRAAIEILLERDDSREEVPYRLRLGPREVANGSTFLAIRVS